MTKCFYLKHKNKFVDRLETNLPIQHFPIIYSKVKTLLVSTTLLCVITFCKGQTDFRTGYIVTHQKDTVKGLVDYRQGVAQFRSCDFQPVLNGDVTNYQPNEITGYGFVNDKYYASREIEDRGERKIAFLEVIVRGIATLYRFEDSYLVEKNAEGLHLLKNVSKEVYAQGKRVILHSNDHVKTFNLLFFDCVALRPKLKGFRLSERVLTALVEEYNTCKGQPGVTYKAEKNWIKGNVALSGGLAFADISGEDADPFDDDLAEYEAITTPVFGVGFDISSPRINERISFHADILYQKLQYYGFGLVERFYGNNRLYITVKGDAIRIPLGLRYTFAPRMITPFANGGFSTTFLIDEEAIYVREREFDNVVETTTDKLDISKSPLSFWIGAGAIVRLPYKFDAIVDLRYENSKRELMTLSSVKITSIQLTLGIRRK